MSHRRVAITGIGLISPLGSSLQDLHANLKAAKSSIVHMDAWQQPGIGLQTSVGSPVKHFSDESIPRKFRRNMSRISSMAHVATEQAIAAAGWQQSELSSPRTGIAYGSCMGGLAEIDRYYRSSLEIGNLVDSAKSSTFLKIMSHTCAANIAVAFGIPGRVIASCVACASSTQAIGLGYEAIKFGLMERMVCGGAEELNPAVPAVFDVLRATSTQYRDQPQLTPRPFDQNRDGIVVGEGAGTFLLEDLQLARERGATILGEITGFFTNNDASHMTNPSASGLQASMQGALDSAGVSAETVDYINAHATGTRNGDLAEAQAIRAVFGSKVPISSAKGHFGHLMGAAGAVELAAAIAMMQASELCPTLNLETIDSEIGELNLIKNNYACTVNTFIKNSFAFGGVNASLVISRSQV